TSPLEGAHSMTDPRGNRSARSVLLTLLTAILPVSIAFAELARSGAGGSSVGGGSPRIVGIIVKLDDDPVTSYRGTQPGLPQRALGRRGTPASIPVPARCETTGPRRP